MKCEIQTFIRSITVKKATIRAEIPDGFLGKVVTDAVHVFGVTGDIITKTKMIFGDMVEAFTDLQTIIADKKVYKNMKCLRMQLRVERATIFFYFSTLLSVISISL